MSQFIDDLYNAKLKDLKLIAVGLARNTKNNNSTYFPEEKETLQLRVMGGYMSLAKLTKLVDRINKVLLHFPGMTKIFLDYAHEIVPGLYDPTNTIDCLARSPDPHPPRTRHRGCRSPLQPQARSPRAPQKLHVLENAAPPWQWLGSRLSVP